MPIKRNSSRVTSSVDAWRSIATIEIVQETVSEDISSDGLVDSANVVRLRYQAESPIFGRPGLCLVSAECQLC